MIESLIKMNTEDIKKTKEQNMNEPYRLNLQSGDLDYLTKKQVCQKYNISHMTLEKWKTVGLKYYKIGNSRTSMIKYKVEHVNDFLEKHLVS